MTKFKFNYVMKGVRSIAALFIEIEAESKEEALKKAVEQLESSWHGRGGKVEFISNVNFADETEYQEFKLKCKEERKK